MRRCPPHAGQPPTDPGDDDIILRMDAVVGGYGATTVLHETSFAVHRNALTTIIGPNGAGKSTAIKAIFGIVRVRSGHIWYGGDDIVGLDQVELLRRGISFVPQGRNVFPRMTVRANLELGGVSLGNLALTHERVTGIAFELFPMLRAKADRQAGTLSGGEQKMLEIGRAMLLEPRLLLIDEPSVGLSPILVQQVFGLLRQLMRSRNHGADDRAERQVRARGERLRPGAPAGPVGAGRHRIRGPQPPRDRAVVPGWRHARGHLTRWSPFGSRSSARE